MFLAVIACWLNTGPASPSLLAGSNTLMATIAPSTAVVQELAAGPTDSVFPYDGLIGTGTDAHDPSVVEFDGTYVCFTTSGNGFCEMRTSKDLLNWKAQGPILTTPEWLLQAVARHRSTWAPSAIRVGKSLRVYYCASERFGANSSVIGVAENPSFNPDKPLEGWKDVGKIIESKDGVDNFNAIDPDTFIDQKGRHWMVFGSYWSGLYMLELNPTTGLKLDSAKPIHVASNTGERGNPLEAPYLCYHDGYYYLFVVYGLAAQGVRSTYRMMVGRSKSMEEPFVGFDGKPMTEGGHTDLLKSSPPMFAPGGGNIFKDKDGSYKLAYHFYDGRKHWRGDVWGRPVMQVRDVLWGSDGWPLPGLPAGAKLRKSSGDVAGKWIHQPDFGTAATVELTKDGKIVADGQAGTWSRKGDILTMNWTRQDRPGEVFEDKVQLAYDGRYYVGRNKSGAIIRGIRSDASQG